MHNNVRDRFTAFTKSQLPSVALICEVIAVHGQTCDVLPVGAKSQVMGVRLMATIDDNDEGVLIQPKIGSFVAITFLTDSEGADAVVVMFSEIEKISEKGAKLTFNRDLTQGKVLLNAEQITINDGQNGGLVNVQPVSNDMTLIKAALQAIILAFQTAPIVPSDGGASFKAGLIAATSALQMPSISGYEDTKVTH